MSKRQPPKYPDGFSDSDSFSGFAEDFGTALLRWQHIEGGLLHIFVSVMGHNKSHAAYAIWKSLRHARVQYNVLNELVEIKFKNNQKKLKKWQSFSGRIQRAITDRNSIVHSVPHGGTDNKGKDLTVLLPEFGHHIIDKPMKRMLTHRDINRVERSLYKLGGDLMKYYRDEFAKKRKPSHDKS